MLRRGRRTGMTNQKLQSALDELERLRDTVKEFNTRNSAPPNPDSDVGRALDSLSVFSSELHKLDLPKHMKKKN